MKDEKTKNDMMMKMKSILMTALLVVPGLAAAQNALTVAETTIPQSGGMLQFNITLAAENVYTAVQFQLATPDGVVYDTDSQGDVECTLGTCCTTTHAATVHWNANTKILGVGIASINTSYLKGTSGSLISIPLLATEEAVGTELSFTATDVTFIRLNGEKDKLSDLNFTITVGEPDDGRLKFDENATTLPAYTAGDKADVTMKRTIKGGEWSTICLPFTLPKAKAEAAFGADAKYYKFSGFETTVDVDGDMIPTAIQLNFTEHKLTSSLSSISGGTPYLVKTTQDVTEIKVDQVKLVAAVEPTTVEDVNYDVLGGKFTGTFVKTKVPSDGLFISGDQFWYSTGNTNIKAFRAWFDLDVVLNKEIELSRITMNFVDDDTTGITNTNSTNDTNEWYTVSGVKVEKPVRKGLYIQNGKKKVVK